MARIESETAARQGSKGVPVLYVLIGTMILAVLATVGVLTWQGAASPPDRASQSQEAARATATGESTGSVSRERSGNPVQTPAKSQ